MTMNLTPASPTPATSPDLATIKARQKAAWATGDFSVVGMTLQIVGEQLCEAADVRAGEKVLDAACGNGNATLAAARRFATVTGLDFVPALLDNARERAAAERLVLDLHEGDAENMPFPDASFDVVLSTYGIMFTPDQERMARELARVCRPGGRIGLANWTPEGFIGQLFKVLGRHVAPAPGLSSPALWGTKARLETLFADTAARITATPRDFMFRYLSADHFLDVFRTYYGPVNRAFAALDAKGQAALAEDILALCARFDRSGGASLVVPGEYLEVVIERK